ncbi:unnamed protein product [Pedinophyceae sp. YPF-701]|nr:unnamed protein product [Pedinophyceae sp. YPF-701]
MVRACRMMLGPSQRRVLVVLVAVLLCAHAVRGFVTTAGQHFVNERCEEYFVAGWNEWKVMETASSDPGALRTKLQRASRAGFNVLRFFAHGSDDDFVLQARPGEYNEAAWVGIDRALFELSQLQMKAILSFSNMWKAPDGKKTFVSWRSSEQGVICDIDACRGGDDDQEFECLAANCPSEDEFFKRESIVELYKAHINATLHRINSLTGVAYKDDPTIFAWDVMNEPNAVVCRRGLRPARACVSLVDDWIARISAYIKSIDSRHMVTTGVEGYYGPEETPARRAANPQPTDSGPFSPLDWPTKAGQSFLLNHRHPTIDFAVFHAWPDNWRSATLEFQDRWLAQHLRDSAALGKPVIVEEFGKVADRNKAGDIAATRDPFFAQVYNATNESIASGGALKASSAA